MERNARLQTLTLALLCVLAWLCLDLAALPAAVTGYLGEAFEETPAEPRRQPTLIGRGEAADSAQEEDETADVGGSGGCHGPTIPLDDALPKGPGQAGASGYAVVPTIVVDSPPTLRDIDATPGLLGLSGRQEEELRRLLDDARRDLDDLRRAVNEHGVTWYSMAEAVEALRQDGDLRALLDATAELEAFARTALRGSPESYEAARRRVVASHADLVRTHLTPDQQVRWDRCDPCALFEGAQGPLRPLRAKWAHRVRKDCVRVHG